MNPFLFSLLALFALFSSSVSAMADTPFRLAVGGLGAGACAPFTAAAPAGLAAYVRHLETRLERPVHVCPANDLPAAAALVAATGADLALINSDAAASVPDFSGKARAILAPRLSEEYGRVEMLGVTPAASPRKTVRDFAGARVVLGGTHRVAAEGPFRALADQGVTRAALGAVTQAGDPDVAVQMLRAGKADLMLLHASAWFRLCRPTRPGEKKCADLQEAFRGRPRAKLAWAAPLSLNENLRYRLIGIHIAMHLEAPAAYAWVAAQAPGAESIDPTEAGALMIGR